MRILVLGGTRFLSRAVAEAAVGAGHTVTVAARGESGAVPQGVEHVFVDRSDADSIATLGGSRYDAVIDVARKPSWVRDAVAALGDSVGHWTFVSSVSVYADEGAPGQGADAKLLEAAAPDADETDMELYGPLKVACEEAVRGALGDRAFICRPGLIVGPGDPSGRFTYWPHRLAAGGQVVAPGSPDDSVQLIDVRDVATWLVRAATAGLTGALDAVSPPRPRGEVLSAVARAVGSSADLVWIAQDILLEHGVEPWMGPRSLPLWVPLPEYDGFMTRDVTASLAAGLPVRSVEETARDTLAWLRETPDAVVGGLTAVEEAELLAAWQARD